jgi:hypothetical protein
MIITMKQHDKIKPRRGEINGTPAGLGDMPDVDFYNRYTPTGLKI